MWQQITKLFWNAVPLVSIILFIGWYFGWIELNTESSVAANTNVTIVNRRGVVEAIKNVNKQIFIEHYNMVDLEYSEMPQGWVGLLGIKQDFIVLVRGRVPAGFALDQLNEESVWVSSDGKRIQLTLPPPIIFEENVTIDFEGSRIVAQADTCPNFICQDDLGTYQAQVLPAATDLLIEYAHENNILEQAAKDGKSYYEQFLRSFGFEEVQVIILGHE